MKLKNVKLKDILKEAFQHLSGKHFWMLNCEYISLNISEYTHAKE